MPHPLWGTFVQTYQGLSYAISLHYVYAWTKQVFRKMNLMLCPHWLQCQYLRSDQRREKWMCQAVWWEAHAELSKIIAAKALVQRSGMILGTSYSMADG